jgi:hypothetical protein
MRTVRDISIYLVKSGTRRVANGVSRLARRTGLVVRRATSRGSAPL